MKRIGFAGLGIMGSRMAANFIKKGYPLTVWNRSPGPIGALCDLGAVAADNPEALAANNDVVFSCLSDPAAVRDVYLNDSGLIAGLTAGKRLVDTSTISPNLARTLATACREKGAEFLESPVTGSKQGAQDGTLLLMTAGRKEIHDELLPVLLCIGQRAIYLGEAGMGQTTKLVGNTIISFMLEALAEGLTLGRAAGMDPAKILEVVQASGFASPYWNFKGGAMIRGDYDTHFSLKLLHKDQALALDLANQHLVPMPALAAIHQVATTALTQGLGNEDMAAIIKAIKT